MKNMKRHHATPGGVGRRKGGWGLVGRLVGVQTWKGEVTSHARVCSCLSHACPENANNLSHALLSCFVYFMLCCCPSHKALLQVQRNGKLKVYTRRDALCCYICRRALPKSTGAAARVECSCCCCCHAFYECLHSKALRNMRGRQVATLCRPGAACHVVECQHAVTAALRAMPPHASRKHECRYEEVMLSASAEGR